MEDETPDIVKTVACPYCLEITQIESIEDVPCRKCDKIIKKASHFRKKTGLLIYVLVPVLFWAFFYKLVRLSGTTELLAGSFAILFASIIHLTPKRMFPYFTKIYVGGLRLYDISHREIMLVLWLPTFLLLLAIFSLIIQVVGG